MNNNLDNPYYYLENFRFVLAWVLQRYHDLLDQNEIDFIDAFARAPIQSQGLLVRMIMRKGDLFRASKLNYEEIGEAHIATQFLIEQGWIQVDPCISADQLFGIATKREFAQALGILGINAASKSSSKASMLELAGAASLEPRRYSEWGVIPTDTLYQVCVTSFCDRIRLMFFGNLYQDWSEFVLADLGIFTYEKMQFSEASRAFQHRHDIDTYMHLQACRERLHNGKPLQDIEREIDTVECANPWLQMRLEKTRFQIGQQYEQNNDWENALVTYARCDYPGARLRRIRVLEKDGQTIAALTLAESAAASPESTEELQHIGRIMPRLKRKLGHEKPAKPTKAPLPRFDFVLPKPMETFYVEEVARLHIEHADKDAPIYYVENALINSLFGLLCWDAIFSAVPGAFFHPFQSGPADLHSADFRKQRVDQFHHALSQLESQQYKQTIRDTFIRKAGIQSPFVFWGTLSESLLEHALQCFPAKHLLSCFDRILDDIAANRSGFPDLIQFWPHENRYRMIEIKGPGDKLQDNQIRFLDFCLANDMPVAVCYVEWEDTGA